MNVETIHASLNGASYNLYQTVYYIAANRIQGDFVECSVLLGGASIMMTIFAENFGLRDRRHYIFDTFCGFTCPIVEIDFADQTDYPGGLPRFRSIVEQNIARCGHAFELAGGLLDGEITQKEFGEWRAFTWHVSSFK